MKKRFLLITVVLLLVLGYTIVVEWQQRSSFSRSERRVLYIPTAGLFEKCDSFTISSVDLQCDGWYSPLEDGEIFTPESKHASIGWYIKMDAGKQEVKAAMPGVVRMVRTTNEGKTVVVLHSNGLESVYAHCAKTLVRVGDYVYAGQPVAWAEESDGQAFSYFVLMVNGSLLNPGTLAEEDGSLKSGILLFRRETDGRIKASRHSLGLVAESKPDFKWAYAPPLVDLERPLTAMERQHVKVPTPGLFKYTPTFSINLARLEDWSYPLPGAKVASPYGGRRVNHVGTDLKTFPNDTLRAVFDGLVRFSGPYSSYGNVVVLRHANGLETLYSHNSKNLVRQGDWVKAGAPIGLMGQTGRATGPHLHFEVRVNGVPFNSDNLFDHSLHTLKHQILVFERKPSGRIHIKVEWLSQ